MATTTTSLVSLCIFSSLFTVKSSQSTLYLSEHYPGFDGINENIFKCSSNTKDGSFLFDSGRGIAYFASSDDMFYLEYYAPMFYWTGFASSGNMHFLNLLLNKHRYLSVLRKIYTDQSVDGKDFHCIDCLSKNNKDISLCKEECIIDHIFLTSGQSDDVQSWISMELKIDSQLKLPNLKSPSAIIQSEVIKTEICQINDKDECYQYVHIKLYRPYENTKGDKFMVFNNDNNEACFSWITSDPAEGAFITAIKASTVKYYNVVCTQSRYADICSIHQQQQQQQQVQESIISIPQNQFIIPHNPCKQNDLSLVILMDLSDSINYDSINIGKEWIKRTIYYGKQLLSQNNLNFRSSLITFSSKMELIWNLNDDDNDEFINDKLNNLDRPHDALTEQGLTFTKDALKNVINNALPLKNGENDQILVVILTDGLPSYNEQNPCIDTEISDIFHLNKIRTVIVGIEEGNTFNTSPFQCLYYPYSTDISFVAIENFQSLIGYQMHPIIIDSAFPITCNFNNDIKTPSNLYGPHLEPQITNIHQSQSHESQSVSEIINDENNHNQQNCFSTEEYVPIKKFIKEEEEEEDYHECNQGTTEWRLELIDWQYYQHHDKTEYKYSICTSYLQPFDHCKISESEIDETSKILKNIALQMPCDCEVCIGYAVDQMEPLGRFAQLEKAWIWSDLDIEAGQCKTLTMTLMGYAETVDGNYFLEGNNKYENGKIQVPNPCNDGLNNMLYPIPHIPSKDSYPNPKASKCIDEKTMEPYYPKYCEGICDLRQMEYDIKFVDYKYNKGDDKTIFTYSLSTLLSNNLPKDFCSYYPYEESIPLREIHLSLPCQCQHLIQNGNTLLYVTHSLLPHSTENGVSDFYWHFKDLYIKPGETKNISIILNGMIPFGFGDYTLIGDMNRCGYGRHIIRVPDICNNRCLWGQWTEWETKWTSCSKKCGGGYTKRTRKCVSVCDGKTQVNNCHGESQGIVPCNTHKCVKYPDNYQQIKSSAKYWSAY